VKTVVEVAVLENGLKPESSRDSAERLKKLIAFSKARNVVVIVPLQA
jgi:hypothetical protein